jgi:hypothetical protein
MSMLELSQCAVAMLVAMVIDSERAIDTDELRLLVPPGEIGLWFDQLQALLDRGYVDRVSGPDRYRYLVTRHGHAYLAEHFGAWVHKRAAARLRRSVA